MQKKLDSLRRLVETIDALRDPGGCPWDRAQTLKTMSRYLLEEVSEAVDAIHDAEGRPEPTVREELGDVLMNVVLAARIAEDERAFDLGEIGYFIELTTVQCGSERAPLENCRNRVAGQLQQGGCDIDQANPLFEQAVILGAGRFDDQRHPEDRLPEGPTVGNGAVVA